MEVTSVRFANAKPRQTDGVCGLCSVSLDNSIVIHGIKVKLYRGQLMVSLPERRVGKDDVVKPVVTILSDTFKEELKEVVFNKYLSLVSEHPNGYTRQ